MLPFVFNVGFESTVDFNSLLKLVELNFTCARVLRCLSVRLKLEGFL